MPLGNSVRGETDECTGYTITSRFGKTLKMYANTCRGYTSRRTGEKRVSQCLECGRAEHSAA